MSNYKIISIMVAPPETGVAYAAHWTDEKIESTRAVGLAAIQNTQGEQKVVPMVFIGGKVLVLDEESDECDIIDYRVFWEPHREAAEADLQLFIDYYRRGVSEEGLSQEEWDKWRKTHGE